MNACCHSSSTGSLYSFALLCSMPLLPHASQAWAAGRAATALLLAASQECPDAAASLQRSMLAFWESVAATLLQPEQPLQEYAALAWALHRQGRLLHLCMQVLCPMTVKPAGLTGLGRGRMHAPAGMLGELLACLT